LELRKTARKPARCYLRLACAISIGLLMSNCTMVGPKAISTGRLAYNEAIAETNNQQMLMVLVHDRYEAQGSMLAVASVTANVSIRSSAGIEAGFGGDSSFEGNLVPFSGGFIYEENPTISYTPVAGESYLRQLTRPIPLQMLAQLTRAMTDSASVFIAMISSVNGIYNPDFMCCDEGDDPHFDRFVTIMYELTRAHRLHWVEDSNHKGQFSIVIDQSKSGHATMVSELLQLLGLSSQEYREPRIVIPVRMSLNGAQEGVIGVTTRSIFDMVEVLAARVQVPQRDTDNGVVADYPPPGRLGRGLSIHYSDEEPQHAYVKVNHRGGWFYIDERDVPTKRYFRLLGSMWSVAIASSAAEGPAAPILTVPVSN